jgi:hypothetical protein
MPSRTPRLAERVAQRQRQDRQRQLHRERMRRYRARQRLQTAIFGEEHAWTRVLDARLRRNKLEFHVEWEPENDRAPYTYTWEPATTFFEAAVFVWIHDHDSALLQKVLDLKAIQEAQ